MRTIGFGGGCHWCTEAVFRALQGVVVVDQGFVAAAPPHDSFSEAALVHYAPGDLSLSVLTEIHLRTHASRSQHSFRQKYRSAIYVPAGEDRKAAQDALTRAAARTGGPIVTQVLDLVRFRPSAPEYRNYYDAGPERPFCRQYIDPKLDLLREEYGAFLTGETNRPGALQRNPSGG